MRQVSAQAEPVVTTGGETTASEDDDIPRYVTRSRISNRSINSDASSGLVNNVVDNLPPFSAIPNTVAESASVSSRSNGSADDTLTNQMQEVEHPAKPQTGAAVLP